MKTINLLGSTGSIGVQTLDVARRQGYKIAALAAYSDYKKLEEQIREFKPTFAALVDENAAKELKTRVADMPVKILSGSEGVSFCAAEAEGDTVLNAVVGMAGLKPTLDAIKAKKTIALANKETLVAGGELVTKAVKENGVKLLPVDSEHSAIFQCLLGAPKNNALKRIILTASGGPFFGKTPEELKQDFVDRQNQETAWIGKVVLGWCKDICFAQPTLGTLTAYLRRQLQFDRIIPQIRFSEGKPLYDTDKKMLDSNKLKEILENVPYDKLSAIKPEFEKYCADFFKPCDTTKDYAKALARFQTEIYGSLDKRCDHRHHAVDAAVIGLCSVSIVQKAQNFYKKHNTLYIKAYDERGNRDKKHDVEGFLLENDTIPNLARIRKEVQARLTNYVVWHKPDHFPSGALFDQTAYNVLPKDGEKRFVKRAPLVSFLKANEKKTLENLEKLLFCDAVKNEIITQFKERLAQGMTQEEALCGKKDDPSDGIYYRGNKVKQVKYMYLVGRGIRVFDENADKEIFSTDNVGTQHKKAYQNGGDACMDFDAKTGKRLALIPLWQYQSKKQVPPGVVRVFIGDMLFNKKDKEFYKIKQFNSHFGVGIVVASEVKGDLAFTSNLKDYSVVSTRQDIAKLKDNEHTTSD